MIKFTGTNVNKPCSKNCFERLRKKRTDVYDFYIRVFYFNIYVVFIHDYFIEVVPEDNYRILDVEFVRLHCYCYHHHHHQKIHVHLTSS